MTRKETRRETRKATWFESETWSPEIAAKFDEKLTRARGQKRHALTTQAGLLVRHGFLDDGIALYRRAAALDESPGDERTMVLGWLAQVLIAALRFDDAVEAARAAVSASAPNERTTRGARTPEELLAFALRRRGKTGDEEEAVALLAKEDALREPLDLLRGRFDGLDATGKPYADIEELAEAFAVTLRQTDALREPAEVEALRAATPAALEALDRLWCRTPPMFGPFQKLRRRFLFEAGAYVGRVLVRAGGTWQVPPDAPLTASRVVLNGKTIDPFELAYEALLNFEPLVRSFARVSAP